MCLYSIHVAGNVSVAIQNKPLRYDHLPFCRFPLALVILISHPLPLAVKVVPGEKVTLVCGFLLSL